MRRGLRSLPSVVGSMGQKDAIGCVVPCRGIGRHVGTVAVPGTMHEAPQAAAQLAAHAAAAGLDATPAESVESALRLIAQRFPGDKRILICGSLYLAGHVLARQQGVTPQPN